MERILIVTEVFYPENGLINDFVTELVSRGYHIEVLTQHPSYPLGRVFEGYKNDDYSVDEWKGVKIHRFKVVEGYRDSKLKKIANYYKFVRQGGQIARRIGGDFDHILVYQTGPLTLALPAVAIKKKFGTPLTTWTFDIWPDAVYAYGFPRGFPLTAFLSSVIKKVYRNSDNIFVNSRNFIPSIERYAPGKPVYYAPSWLIDEPQQKSVIKLDSRKFNFTFTGNISKAQNLENVMLGWQKAGLQSDAILNIVGDGSSLNHLKELVAQEKIEGVVFHGRQPSAQILDILDQSSVLVMPLVSDPGIMKTEPYKLQSYLMAGKPIFGVIDGAGREIIDDNKLGLCAQPYDVADIAAKFIEMINFEQANCAQMYDRSQTLRAQRYDRSKIIETVIQTLTINKQ